jgi:hypothetical protein
VSVLPAFAAALLDPDAPRPAGLRAWNGSDPGPRYDVHRNNVTTSLVRALEDGFPVTCALVGTDFFRAMAREFVRAAPPRSPVLLEYGAGFAGFIAGFAPAARVPFLADMARFERARLEAFHAADAQALDAAAFSPWLAAPQALMRRGAVVHPSLRLLRGLRPVLALWCAHQPGGEAGLADALESAETGKLEDLLVLRPGLDVHATRLPPGAATTLACLQAGANVGDALAAAATAPGFDLAAVLAVLVHRGALVALPDPAE